MLRSKPPAGPPPWQRGPLAGRLLAALAAAYLLSLWQLPSLWNLSQPAGTQVQQQHQATTTSSSVDADDEPVLPPALGGGQGGGAAPPLQQQRLRYPLWWHAPFFSGTGYGTEAISYIVGLLHSRQFQSEDVWISQSGDKLEEGVVWGLENSTRELLQVMRWWC